MSERDPNVIEAIPTKELFVFMLTRDLTLRDAIGDLVDNSADGAKKLRPDKDMGTSRNRLEPDNKYNGLSIKIQANQTEFSISDNCGGISSDVARDYAFRFGRPKEMEVTPGSVGQFGIGMKRALFKLGRYFHIESTAINSKFTVKENVDEWIVKKDWNFLFNELVENTPNDESKRGTSIKVKSLRQETITNFKLDKFIDNLRKEIEKEQLYNIHRGLSITINDQELKSRQLLLLQSKDFQTAHFKKTYTIKENSNKGQLHVEIFVGISDEKTEHGGWYIFCNDRLIIGNDQTESTGWGEERKVPKYHSQYDRFRGYVFFNSINADLLPWNTVKNNMDLDNPYFLAVRLQMIHMMRPVINFLNWLHDERQKIYEPKDRVLANALSEAKSVALSKVQNLAPIFSSPKPPPSPQMQDTRIAYRKPKLQVDEAKNFFKVSSNPDVGVKTFNYWYQAEVDNEP